MRKLQDRRVPANENSIAMTAAQEDMCGMTNTSRQQLHDLTRLRIERNRAARHARCATIRK